MIGLIFIVDVNVFELLVYIVVFVLILISEIMLCRF